MVRAQGLLLLGLKHFILRALDAERVKLLLTETP